MAVCVTRCANIYGPGDLNFSRIIPDTLRAVICGQPPVIRSDGTPLRDYIFVKDVVKAYLKLARALFLHQNKFSGQAFNFGTGRPISVLNLVNKIIKISGKIYLRPKILSKRKIKGEIDRQYLSSRKAKTMLGWQPEYNLEKGLKETFSWYRSFLEGV